MKKLLLSGVAMLMISTAMAQPIQSPSVPKTWVGAPSGVAPLDGSAKLPGANVPFGTTTGTVGDGGALTSAAAAAAAAQTTASAAVPSTAVGVTVAPLASPAFTGTPTVPTAPTTTNTTQAASTAFATTAVAGEATIARAAETANATAAAAAQTTANGAIPLTQKAAPSGVAALDFSGSLSANTSVSNGTINPRTLGARGADIFNVRDFGAVGDGTLHTAGQAGMTTLSTLCLNYAFMCSGYPWGQVVNMPIGALAASGSTTLTFSTTMATTSAASPPISPLTTGTPGTVGGSTLQVFYGQYLERTPTGTPITYLNSAGSTTVTIQSTACTGNTPSSTCTLTLTAPLTVAPFADSGTTLQSSWQLILTDTTGVYQGEQITCPGSNLQSNEYVEYVNRATNVVMLTTPTIGQVPGTTSCTFTQPGFANVTVGARVLGNGVPNGDTVASVNAAAGTITITAATTGALQPATSLSDSTHAPDGSLISIFSEDTNTQAAAESMDSLGIQATIIAAEATTTGGSVYVPFGKYLMTQGSEIPEYNQFNLSSAPSIGITGDGPTASVLESVGDLGFEHWLISCGDPAGSYTNIRGMYAGNGDNFCANPALAQFGVNNRVSNLGLTVLPPSGSTITGSLGAIPKLSPSGSAAGVGVPIMMGGVKQGARLDLDNVSVKNFLTPIYGTDPDHTRVMRTNAWGFWGYYMGAANGTLFGDDDFTDDTFSGTFAGIGVHATSYINANLSHVYLASAPYTIWGDTGNPPATNPNGTSNGNSQLLQGVQLHGESNMEWAGCGGVVDGNRETNTGGSFRSISSTTIEDDFWSRLTTNELPGGCAWAGYVNVFNWDGGGFYNLWSNTMASVSGAPLVVLNRVGDFNGDRGLGSFTMSGTGLNTLISNQAAINQPLVADSNSDASLASQGLINTDGWRRVRLEVPGAWVGGIAPIDDAGAPTSLARGAVLETNTLDTVGLSAQRFGAGGTGTGIISGINMQAWPSAPNGKLTAVAHSGSEVPVSVGAAAAIGALLYPPVTAAPGVASATGTTPLAQVSNANSASVSQVWGQMLTTTGN